MRAPVLLVYGLRDERVPVQPSISRITDALRAEANYALKVFPDADHGFRVKPRPGSFSWPQTATHYPDAVVDWASRVTRR